jgi:hypothetical protein
VHYPNGRGWVATLASEIDSTEWCGLAKKALVLAALVVLLDGLDIQLPGFSIGLMAKDFGVTHRQRDGHQSKVGEVGVT